MTPTTPTEASCVFCRAQPGQFASLSRRIADLAAEARALSATTVARAPELTAAYFWTKAAVLTEIAAG